MPSGYEVDPHYEKRKRQKRNEWRKNITILLASLVAGFTGKIMWDTREMARTSNEMVDLTRSSIDSSLALTRTSIEIAANTARFDTESFQFQNRAYIVVDS